MTAFPKVNGPIDLKTKIRWSESPDIRPYVFVRPENKIPNPGTRHRLDWFSQAPIFKNPLKLDEVAFADAIYFIEERAFGPSNMAMPRWVFYDCAIIPGFVAGFAARYQALNPEIQQLLEPFQHLEWVPLSLFIIIPTMHKGEWVAHNLCSVNSLVSKPNQFHGLGFLSKAFGLWYANVALCSGMTQWASPALKLHSHYGHLEVIGAFAPTHSFAKTVTYRVEVDVSVWEKFFNREPDLCFLEKYENAGFVIDPKNEKSMISLHRKIEGGEGPFYLSAGEIAQKQLHESLSIFKPKGNVCP